MNNRKAALRNNPAWLDALELPEQSLPAHRFPDMLTVEIGLGRRVVHADFTQPYPALLPRRSIGAGEITSVDVDVSDLRGNAAEEWHEQLNAAGVPDTAAGLRIIELRRELTERAAPIAMPVAPGGTCNYEFGPMRGASWFGWPLASFLLMLGIVVACAQCAHF